MNEGGLQEAVEFSHRQWPPRLHHQLLGERSPFRLGIGRPGLMGQLWPEAEQFRNGSTLIMAVFQTAYVAEGEEGKDKRKRLKYGGLSR